MKDPRFEQLADVLVRHSASVSANDRVLIEATDVPAAFVSALIHRIDEAGGEPQVIIRQTEVMRSWISVATESQMSLTADLERACMEQMQCYIGIRGSNNIAELSDVPSNRFAVYEQQVWKRVHGEVRVPKTRWVVLRWPTSSMAQAAGMSTEAFEDFYFRVCAETDYAAMAVAMEPLESLMKVTDRVKITGPGTDLSFSIKGITAIACSGERNIPDGECFTCPVRDSINGVIQFNAETLYRGTVFSGIRLVFRDGKIVEATEQGGNTAKLNQILDADEGARYVGEWSLGLHPHILHPMKDILFDEKIAGSFHLTPGQAYEEADNGNRSQIHWDMVLIQRADYGGGEIWFDDVLVRKDGLFVLPELLPLNQT